MLWSLLYSDQHYSGSEERAQSNQLLSFQTGSINALAVNINGTYLCTASSDKSIKFFDVVNFDMINMVKLDFEPKCAEWIHNPNDAIPTLAVYVLCCYIRKFFGLSIEIY